MHAHDRTNMNSLRIDDESKDGLCLSDPAISKSGVSVRSHFRDIKNHLLGFIGSHDVIIGCVAWLTDHDILRELSRKMGVSIIVQKEDFLRPDSRGTKTNLRALYDALKSINRSELPGIGASLSTNWADDEQAIRCVGNLNSNKSPAHPRSHHKFVVGCDLIHTPERYAWEKIVPKSVWTGSYNFTHNASLSLENAVEIHDADFADAYAEEYQQVLALSEPLEWSSDWCAPQYRIGT